MPENPKNEIPPRARIFRGNTDPHEIVGLPDPPPWREFSNEAREEKGKGFRILADSDGASKTVDIAYVWGTST